MTFPPFTEARVAELRVLLSRMTEAAVAVLTDPGYQFAAPGRGMADAATDPRIALIGVCVASQQVAGYGFLIDLREAACPTCRASGFNTGLGFWRYTCGAEILTSGDVDRPCAQEIRS